ncbi:MAG: AAA family ATPase, partial [Acidobacteriota bacterium]|nr:AAA family ATPase [Acidobacteriota bacterium]
MTDRNQTVQFEDPIVVCTLPRDSASSRDDGGARGGAVPGRVGERSPAVGKDDPAARYFPHYRYVSLESPDERRFAHEDPRGFLGRFDGPVILDEAQRAPDLFSYIQTIVDEDPAPGRFLLSGSRNFLLMQSISQSLAGRVRLTSLLPFSLSELTLRDVPSMDELLDGGARPPAPVCFKQLPA